MQNPVIELNINTRKNMKLEFAKCTKMSGSRSLGDRSEEKPFLDVRRKNFCKIDLLQQIIFFHSVLILSMVMMTKRARDIKDPKSLMQVCKCDLRHFHSIWAGMK